MDTQTTFPGILQRVLFSFGILAPLMFVAADRIGGRLLKGYSFSAHSMSDLTASGSPARALVVTLNMVAVVLMIAFGIGVWRAAGQMVFPRIVAGLVIGNAATSLFATLFFPNIYGVRPVFASPGVLIMLFSVLFSVLAIIFGAVAYSGWFRLFSILIPSAFIVLTVVRLVTFSSKAAGAEVSMVGSQERTMAYAFFLWVMTLAVYLLLAAGKRTGTQS